jgi:excisionase family DNA binding protein
MTMRRGGREDAMRWMKIDEARRYAGGVSRKLIYRAVATGSLRAARVGAGRSLLFHDHWIDEWLVESAKSLADVGANLESDGSRLRLVKKIS